MNYSCRWRRFDIIVSVDNRHNKKLSCRKETVRLRRGGQFRPRRRITMFCGFCGHYRSIFNQRDVIDLQCKAIEFDEITQNKG